MRDRYGSCLARIIDKIALSIIGCFFPDDLDRVLVGSDGAVGSETVEEGAKDVLFFGAERRVVTQGGMRDVVDDPDGEVVLRLRRSHLVKDAPDHGGSELLRRQSIASPYDLRKARRGTVTRGEKLGEGGHDILIKRLSHAPGLLGAIQHCNHPRGGRQGGHEVL